MVMRGIFLSRWPYRQPSGHAQMNDQDPIGMETNKQIFRTPVHRRNRTVHRLSLQGSRVHHIAQSRLPHSHAGNGSADKLWL
jgi:hypothetical protein